MTTAATMTARKQGKKFEGPITEYKEKYLRCRGRRNHPWKVKTDFNIVTKKYRGKLRITEFTQILHCPLCTADRHDTYSVKPNGHFEKIRTEYKYADGYQLHRGSRATLEEARDELLMRELSGSIEGELFERLAGMRGDVQRGVERPRLRVVG